MIEDEAGSTLPKSKKSVGLRERKKVKTRSKIQRQALRLFREHGYERTTVSQIAEAAEVSESTFFRYFPVKEDVVLWDPFDPELVEIFRAQPSGLSTIAALRAAFREVMTKLSTDEWAEQRERTALMLSVPPLRAMLLDHLRGPLQLLAGVVAERINAQPHEPQVRAIAGAVFGICLAAMFTWQDTPGMDLVTLIDDGLARLEGGLGSHDDNLHDSLIVFPTSGFQAGSQRFHDSPAGVGHEPLDAPYDLVQVTQAPTTPVFPVRDRRESTGTRTGA